MSSLEWIGDVGISRGTGKYLDVVELGCVLVREG